MLGQIVVHDVNESPRRCSTFWSDPVSGCRRRSPGNPLRRACRRDASRESCPPVTAAVGIRTMLAARHDDGARLNRGFTPLLPVPEVVLGSPGCAHRGRRAGGLRSASSWPFGSRSRSPRARIRDRSSGLPRWTYHGLQGDATGFYAAAREFMAAWGRVPPPLLGLLVLAVLAAAVALVWAWRRRPELRPWLPPLALLADRGHDRRRRPLDEADGAPSSAGRSSGGSPCFPTAHSASASAEPRVGTSASRCRSHASRSRSSPLRTSAQRLGTALVGLLAAGFWAFWPLLVGVIADTTPGRTTEWMSMSACTSTTSRCRRCS